LKSWIDQAHCHGKLNKPIQGRDRSVSETYDHQAGTT
jgi:hypothetical protein